MATAQSTGKTRSTRNRPARSRSKGKSDPSPKLRREVDKDADRSLGSRSDEDRGGDLEGLIEDERGRLQKAEAVLECLQFALTYDDYFEPNEAPSYSDVADVARRLIRTAVNHLDSLYVGRRVLAQLAGARAVVDD